MIKVSQKSQTRDNRTFTLSKLKFRHYEDDEKDNQNLMRLHRNTHQETILSNLHITQQETKVQPLEDLDHHHQTLKIFSKHREKTPTRKDDNRNRHQHQGRQANIMI
jgi:hypothetical protein